MPTFSVLNVTTITLASIGLITCLLSFFIILTVWQKKAAFKNIYVVFAWLLQAIGASLFVKAYNWEFGLTYYFLLFSLLALGANAAKIMLNNTLNAARKKTVEPPPVTAHLSLSSFKSFKYMLPPSFNTLLKGTKLSCALFWRFFSVVPLAVISVGLLLTVTYTALPYNLNTRVAVVTFMYPLIIMLVVFYQCFTSNRLTSNSLLISASVLSAAYLFI